MSRRHGARAPVTAQGRRQFTASRRRRSRESGGSRGRRAHRQRMPIVPRAYVTPVPDGIVDAEGRAFAHSRGA
ncbi:conserved hypothetical protein [Burkholderia pseudomallei Pakistan 9]|uniref:Uncharacterized protein n=1 Tax=Burkholderia pseudomallei 1710a TaxID=320371 RepID=A0A0E1VQK0_BURPE|nr:conserved hypothetical protein [Burkholderia pseudomallei Pakistan 9]EET03103.1 hypothetical protein BURPS1710A_A0500 [Burkholderia pseudomallei 1710a]